MSEMTGQEIQITDDIYASLLNDTDDNNIDDTDDINDNNDDDGDINDSDTDDNDDTNGDNTNAIDDDEDDDDLLDQIDKEKLDASARLIYDYLEKKQQEVRKKEIGLEIDSSGLSIKHKLILQRMADSGMSRKMIRETIVDMQEQEKSTARAIGNGKFVPKNKTKTQQASSGVKQKTSARDYGAMLAEKRYNNQGGF